MGKITKQHALRQHNDIINGSYEGSISELRLFYCFLAKVDWEQAITTDTRFYITVQEYADLCGMQVADARNEIEYALNKMGERWIELAKPDSETGKAIITRWLVSRSRDVEVGDKIMAGFSSEIIPFISKLKETGNFTITRIGQILKLPSYYAIRLYNIAIENLNMPMTGRHFYLEIDKLRKMFKVETKYKPMIDFKRNVLDFSVGLISKHNDIILGYNQKMKGRKIIGFDFYIIPKNEVVEHAKNPKKANPYSRCTLSFDGAKRLLKKGESLPQLYFRLAELGFMFDHDVDPKHYNQMDDLFEVAKR